MSDRRIMKGVSIPGFRISKDGKKVEADHAAREAKLDVSTKIKRRSSKRVRVVKRGGK
jgi:hypothetical protein